MVFSTTKALFKRGVEFDVEQDDFEFKNTDVDAVFRSRRSGTAGRGKSIRVLKQPAYLPQYQLVARVTSYASRLEKPQLGFSVKARGTVELAPHQKVVRSI